MLGPAKVRRLSEPIAVSLEKLVPRDNFYRHLEATLDLTFVREWVRDLYPERGRPSIDPVVFFKLQLIMFFEGIRSERKLIETASLHLAHRWYLGYALDEALPDHSRLTRIRQRLGIDIFQSRRVDGCRALVTFAGLIVLHLAFLRTMRRRIGPEPPTPADLLTGCRVVCAAEILTAAPGPGVQTQDQQRRLFVLAVLAATVMDWCDGPLARRFGPTRLGAVMDIEADSLLTLALAAAAVQWGGLSRLAVIPPIVRYSDLVRTVRDGTIFTGDAIWWCRASGGAQMLCFLLALAPGQQQASRSRLRRVAIAVSLVQLVTQVLDGRRRFGPRSASSGS
jgi:phosphatidylglycerophosphate synthase